mgnify:CR=1 FL=1
MTPTRRKTRLESTEPEERETIKRKSKREEPKPPNEPQATEPQPSSPVLTINVHSWATPIVGIVMLLIGALAGFYARPAVLGQSSANASGASPAVAIPTTDQTESQQQLMESLIPRVRHFLGDSNAPVTIIEFGDFQ